MELLLDPTVVVLEVIALIGLVVTLGIRASEKVFDEQD